VTAARERVCTTRATESLALERARELLREHPGGRYSVVPLRLLPDPPRTTDPWAIIERVEVPA
jgi:hypothetical protein